MTDTIGAATNARVKTVSWQESSQTLRQLRRTVFIEEQQVSEQDEWDNRDSRDDTVHFLLEADNTPMGTARILANGQIGRMAILPEYRNRGYGRQLLTAILQWAMTRQFQTEEHLEQFLHAQVQAIPFYEKSGFIATGEEFLDAGIPHKTMIFEPNRQHIEALYEDKVLRLTTSESFCQHLAQSARYASRSLTLLCEHLTPSLWGHPSVVDAISALARKSANSKVQILLQDSAPIIGTRHPLISLCQRMSSRMSIKVLNREVAGMDHAYAIVDKRQLLFFNSEQDLNGFMNYQAPAECRTLLDEFERLWNHSSKADPNLSQLYI